MVASHIVFLQYHIIFTKAEEEPYRNLAYNLLDATFPREGGGVCGERPLRAAGKTQGKFIFIDASSSQQPIALSLKRNYGALAPHEGVASP